mgnify:CR=1 FL=1
MAHQHTLNYYDLLYMGYMCGTKHYMAPEVKEGYFCKSSDMYSLGCILYTIYERKHYKNQRIKLKNKNLNMLVKDLLNINPKHRPNIYDIKSFY